MVYGSDSSICCYLQFSTLGLNMGSSSGSDSSCRGRNCKEVADHMTYTTNQNNCTEAADHMTYTTNQWNCKEVADHMTYTTNLCNCEEVADHMTNTTQQWNCLFVCLFGVYCPSREFFTHMETSSLPVKGCKFDLCSALMAIEQ